MARKKPQWLTELLQGALLLVWIVHFMGRRYITTIWALANAHVHPSRVSRVYCNLIRFGKLIPRFSHFLRCELWLFPPPERRYCSSPAGGSQQVSGVPIYDLLPPCALSSHVVSGWAQPWATCFVLLLKTARQIVFSVCAMKWKTFGKHSFNSQSRRMVVQTLIKHLLHRVEFHYGHLWLPGFIYTAGLITSPEK